MCILWCQGKVTKCGHLHKPNIKDVCEYLTLSHVFFIASAAGWIWEKISPNFRRVVLGLITSDPRGKFDKHQHSSS